MRVAILGGNGFIGSSIGRILTEHAVAVSTIGRPVASSVQERLDNAMCAIRAVGPDAIIHAASAPMKEDQFSWEDERQYLRALSLLAIPTIIIGSAAVLAGATPDASGRLSESSMPVPVSEYGHFKRAQEQESFSLREKGWEVGVVRVFNPIGPKMRPSLMLGRLIREVVDREEAPSSDGTIHMGDLSAYRDYCHVDDGAEAIELLVRMPILPRLVHVGSGVATLTRDLAAIALSESKRPDLRIAEQPSASSGPTSVIADPSLVNSLTGWRARRSLRAAITSALNAQRMGI